MNNLVKELLVDKVDTRPVDENGGIDNSNDYPIQIGIGQANDLLIDYLQQILLDGRQESQELRSKHRVTYWFLVLLSSLMFMVGITLITAPVWFQLLKASNSSQWSGLDWKVSAAALGIGAADLYALYQLHSLARIQKTMGDMSQMTILLNSFQIQVALRLLESNIDDRSSIGSASDRIAAATRKSIGLIDSHFEKWLDKDLGAKSQ